MKQSQRSAQPVGRLIRGQPLGGTVAGLSIAQFISVMGTQITMVALPWFVLNILGTPALLGPLFCARMLPDIIVGPFMGVLADRLFSKPLLVASYLLQGLVQVGMVALWHAGRLSGITLLLVVLVQNICGTPFQVTRSRVIRAIADAGGPTTAATNAALQSSLQAANLVGPAIAAALIAFTHLPLMDLLLLDATTFLVSAALIASIQLPEPRPVAQRSGGSYWRDLLAGFRYAAGNQLVLALVLPGMFDALVYFPTLQIVLPVFVKHRLAGAASLYGVMLTFMAAGALLGSVGLGILRNKASMKWTFALAFSGHVLPLWLLWWFPYKPVLLVSMFLVGLCVGPTMVALMTLMQNAIKGEYVSRVFGLVNTCIMSCILVGYLLFGWLTNRIPIEYVLLSCLCVGLLGAAAALVVPRVAEPSNG